TLSIVTNLTQAQLAQIYDCAGGINNWSDLNAAWPNQPIVRIARSTDSGTYQSWIDLVANGLTNVTEGACIDGPPPHGTRVLGNPDVQTAVKNTPYAIGYVGHGFETFTGIQDVQVNGVQATTANIVSGADPLSRKLHMITPKINKTVRIDQYAAAASFVNYILSPAGQSLVTQQGFIPLQTAQSCSTASLSHCIPGYDVNIDGTGDVLDQVRIGQGNWNVTLTGHPGWIRE